MTKEYRRVELCQGCGEENCDSCPCGTYFARVLVRKPKDTKKVAKKK